MFNYNLIKCKILAFLLTLKFFIIFFIDNCFFQTNIGAIINAMVIHACSTNIVTRKMAIVWLNEICKSYDFRILLNLSAFLIAVLPFIGDILLKGIFFFFLN